MKYAAHALVVVVLLAGSAGIQAEEPASFRDKLASGGESPELVRVPAGKFLMGGGDGASWIAGIEQPRHLVTIGKSFAIGKFEITRGQYRKFVEATAFESTGYCLHLLNMFAYKSGDWRDPGYEQSDEHPVVCISRENAQAYLAWLSKETGKKYRLPTEAEWEYAARAGTLSKYIGSDAIEDVCQYGNVWDTHGNKELGPAVKYCSDGFAFTSPVGKFRANAFGIHDFSGNAQEMVEDCLFENYNGAPADGSAWLKAKCDDYAERGGSWNTSSDYLRVAHRTSFGSDEYDSRTGLRVVRELD